MHMRDYWENHQKHHIVTAPDSLVSVAKYSTLLPGYSGLSLCCKINLYIDRQLYGQDTACAYRYVQTR